jgi:hypothetical protein
MMAMRVNLRPMTLLFAVGLGCGSGATPAAVEPGTVSSDRTGLEGTARRGPVRSICRVDDPCDAPFSAEFEVWEGTRVVTRFHSDSDGRFLVYLPPGTYRVRPAASAGPLARSQVHEVTVAPSGLTQVELNFDTGIL